MIQFLKYILILIFISNASAYSQDYFYFPKTEQNWDIQGFVGLSLTKLPLEVVEEEINQSPLLEGGFRLTSPYNITLLSEFKSNYIVNSGNISIAWKFLNSPLKTSIGANVNGWFGHLDIESINIKARGLNFSPFISLGYDFKDFLLTLQLETHSDIMWTQTEGRELGKLSSALSGYAANFYIEQPLWNDNYVILALKFNYVTFFYQSWLSFNSINEYLLYPEFKFAFVL